MEQEKENDNSKQKPLPRKGWEKALSQMHLNNHDTLLIDDIFKNENIDDPKDGLF